MTGFFEGCVFCIVGMTSRSSMSWFNDIEFVGGKGQWTFDNSVTHLVCSPQTASSTNEVVKRAIQEGNCWIVSEDYLEKCFEYGRRLDESEFLVGPSTVQSREPPRQMVTSIDSFFGDRCGLNKDELSVVLSSIACTGYLSGYTNKDINSVILEAINKHAHLDLGISRATSGFTVRSFSFPKFTTNEEEELTLLGGKHRTSTDDFFFSSDMYASVVAYIAFSEIYTPSQLDAPDNVTMTPENCERSVLGSGKAVYPDDGYGNQTWMSTFKKNVYMSYTNKKFSGNTVKSSDIMTLILKSKPNFLCERYFDRYTVLLNLFEKKDIYPRVQMKAIFDRFFSPKRYDRIDQGNFAYVDHSSNIGSSEWIEGDPEYISKMMNITLLHDLDKFVTTYDTYPDGVALYRTNIGRSVGH